MNKDIKKAIGFFIIAAVAILGGIFCIVSGSIPDWLATLATLIGGFCSALGIYWVNPIQNIVKDTSKLRLYDSSGEHANNKKSILFARDFNATV